MSSMRLAMLAILVTGCARVEPIEAPEDPALPAVPVGVRTVMVDDLVLEVWYPASESARDASGESVDFLSFLSDAFIEQLGSTPDVPLVSTDGVRDAELRNTEDPLPVLLFSHGFAGNRLQSTDLTVHLASRGYVVVAPEHWGRHTTDILPCLFDPALDGCNLSGFAGEDPAPDQLEDTLDWLRAEARDRDSDFYERLDLDTLGLFGHSAGGQSTAVLGQSDERFKALLPMTGSAVVSRDVPVMNMVGTCDGVIPAEDVRADHDASTSSTWMALAGGGHHAFSDICRFGLERLATEDLLPREDVNDLLVSSMITLAGDGCPEVTPAVEGCDAYLDLDRGFEVIRGHATAWFDEVLREGPPLVTDRYPEATVELPD